MDYPEGFPAESIAKIEAARIRAGRQFDSKRAKAKWRSDIEAYFWTCVLTPFIVFAAESSRLGLWPLDKMDEKCREFLRRNTIAAYYQKGKAAGLPEMIDNFSCGIRWQAQQEIEKTSLWRKYENIRLKFALEGRPTTLNNGIIAQNKGRTTQNAESKPQNLAATTGPSVKRLRATVNSSIAARRMETYLNAKGIGQTDFASTVGTTDRTLRSFRRTGKIRRDILESIAIHMGTTKEALLRPE
jgi:hypothetical protein